MELDPFSAPVEISAAAAVSALFTGLFAWLRGRGTDKNAARRLALDDRESAFTQCLRLMGEMRAELAVMRNEVDAERAARIRAEQEVSYLRDEVRRLRGVLDACNGLCKALVKSGPVTQAETGGAVG